MGGGGTTTTIPPPTATEQELQSEQLKLSRMQSRLLQRQQAFEFPGETLAALEAGTSEFAGIDSPQFREELKRRQTEIAENRQLLGDVTERIKARLEGRVVATPEQRALIGETFASSRATGEEDIRRFAEELAGQRGLRLSDTPIGGEALRAQGRLALGLRSAEAGSLLEFGEREKLFEESLRQFQQGLQQQAFANRLSLVGAQPASMLSGLQLGLQERMAKPTTTRQLGFTDIAQGIGGIMQGAGGIATGLSGFSGLGGIRRG